MDSRGEVNQRGARGSDPERQSRTRRRSPGSPAAVLLVSLLAAPAATGAVALPARAAEGAPRNTLGIAVGVPQLIGIEYERTLSSHFELCAHVGSVVLLSSVGARVCRGSVEPGLRPYAFVGGAVIHAEPDKPSDPDSAAAYLWVGPGLAWRNRGLKIYGEVSALLGGSEDRGLGDTTWVFPLNPAISGGIAIRF